jgi:serine/threonine-protein kinase
MPKSTRPELAPTQPGVTLDASPAWAGAVRARYERLATLGRGGMGEVALAVDHAIQRRVAVKRVLPDRRGDPALQRLEEEARVIGQLEHPGIVPVHDVGVDEEGQHFLVMKLLQGETLETVIQRLRASDPSYAARFTHDVRLRIFRSVVQAVRYAHDRGIVHRDLKPANVMVGPYGEVTVLDWGVAKRLGSPPSWVSAAARPEEAGIAGEGILVGTPLYMSPEQALGRSSSVDGRSDLYSLCVMLFELLTLEHPLGRMTSLPELLDALVHGTVRRKHVLRTLVRAGAPCEYAGVLARGLARRPEERPGSLAVLERNLDDIERGSFDVTCPLTAAKRASRGATRWLDAHGRAFMAMFSLGVVAGVAVLLLLAIRLLGGTP